jgi:putative (di)nucleoside polyphosphate hydrolase
VSDAFFRASAGACVIDAVGRVLALRRVGIADPAWQMPQGGIQNGEEPHEAVLREVGEELGLGPDNLELVAEHPGWLVYELPKEYRNQKVGWGQAQKWFLLRVKPGAEVRPDGQEVQAYEWLSSAELIQRVVAFRKFRKPIYEEVFESFLSRASG